MDTNKIQALAEAIRRLNNDELNGLCDMMYSLDLKLTGVPPCESEPDPEDFVCRRNIRKDMILLIDRIHTSLMFLKREELRELNRLVASDGLKFLRIVHSVDYVEP